MFYDHESGFLLDTSGFPILGDVPYLVNKYQHSIEAALYHIAALERGDVINSTAVVAESEDRMVDHYCHRLPQADVPSDSKIPDRNLEASIALWQVVKADVTKLIQGQIVNEEGNKFTDVVFNGIGGSFLGPLMLVLAIRGEGFNGDGRQFRLHFVSNTDPEDYTTQLGRLNAKTTIMVAMSKSGGTSETVGNLEAWVQQCDSVGIAHGPRTIAITTENSGLHNKAIEEDFLFTWLMCNETGGRTSIGSAIGMAPAAFAELDFEGFLRGQSHMDSLTRRSDPLQNPAMLIAIGIDRLTRMEGHRNMIVLGYSSFLKEFSHYLQQLYMESLGKEYTRSGLHCPTGQTVFGGVGTGEQHAFMQQVQKGIVDNFVRFVHFGERTVDIPNSKAGSMGRQLLAFVLGTQRALRDNHRPFLSQRFLRRDTFNLGMMIALEERIVSIMSVFLDINAYDQPGVQDGKLAARSINAASKRMVEVFAELTSPVSGSAEALLDMDDQLKELISPAEFEYLLLDLHDNIKIEHAYDQISGMTVQLSVVDGTPYFVLKP